MPDLSPILHETLAGRYVLKREIGRGGAATVYLAHDIRHERLVAIKVLHPELSHALGAQRFLREIKLTASLQHPHILPIHDSGEASDQLYYVMPYVEGDSMRARLGSGNRLSIEEAVRIGREVIGALAYAHERGVVHRDIKPENILFSGGHAVLADFGIARAIDRAHEKITQQGTITGTPAYMSPEQARDRAFDGRSDVYSLACVLYESIAGVPPFIGETPQLLLSQRISKTPPLLREYRHDVPPPIEAVIAKALSISPDDRYDDARAFGAALSAAIGNSGETGTARIVRRPLTRNPWLWVAGFVLLLVLAAGSSATGRESLDVLTGRVDTAQYAVLPFHYTGGSVSADDEPVAEGIYSALREWSGLRIAGDMKVIDALRASTDTSFSGIMATSRRVRAGKFIWGRVALTHDSVTIRAGLYNAIDGTHFRELTLVGPRDMIARQPGAIRTLAYDLIRLDGTRSLSHSGDVGTRSLAAWHAYQEGQRALAAWQVRPAIAAFERATHADPDYAHAHAWLAQLLVWRSELPARWTPHVSAALRNHASLDEREIMVLSALQAAQEGHYAAACTAYDGLRARDSLDVVAWLGLAHCHATNPLVVRSAASRSGWMFEGSVATAQRAYTRALQIAPAAFGAFPPEYVRRKLFTVDGGYLRSGAGADGTRYVASLDLAGDSIVCVPYSPIDMGAKSTTSMSPANDRALQLNRDVFLGILTTLTQRLPDNAEAFESLARVLEARDEITGTPNGGYSALSALDRAMALATDSAQRAGLGATDVRLHLKLGDFGRTAAIGDSILAATPAATGEAAFHLAGVALLLGRERRAIAYLRASGSSVTIDGAPTLPLLEDVSTALFVRAGLGVCDDSLTALRARIETLLESYVNPTQRNAARTGMLLRPTQFSLACTGAPAILAILPPDQPLLHAIQSLARGSVARARSQLDSLQGLRRLVRPGGLSIDYTVMEAWLRATLGDTAAATRQLDLTLNALPTLTPLVLQEPGMAASFGRSMVYRAELAARTGDTGKAALWANRVLTLWANADPSLAPTLKRMRTIADHRA